LFSDASLAFTDSFDDFKVVMQSKCQRELTALKRVQQIKAHNGPVCVMVFSPCGQLLASVGQDKIIKVWQCAIASDGAYKIDPEPICRFIGHTSDVLALAWSKGKFLLSASMDKTVRLWHVSRTECLGSFQHIDRVTSVAFHPQNEKFFISGSFDESVQMWFIPEHRRVRIAHIGCVVTTVSFGPNGDLSFAGGSNGHVEIFNTQTFEHVSSLDVKSTRGKNSKGQKVTAISFCEDPQLVLITTNDSRLRLYRMHSNFTLTLLCKYMGLKNKLSHIQGSLSPLGSYIIAGSEDCRVYVWNRERQSHMSHFIYHTHKYPTSDAYESFAASDVSVTVAVIPPVKPTPHMTERGGVPVPSPTPPSPGTESLVGRHFFTADMNGIIQIIVNEGLPRPVK